MTDGAAAESLAAWSSVAGGWERRASFFWDVSREVGERLVAALDPRPGETILELASGPGDTGFAAAARVAPDGRLLQTDLVPEMVDAARRRAADRGLENVEHRVVDAQQIDLPDGSVDGVLCRFGYMLMRDPAQALEETHRVLRPGGRVAFSVWAAPEDNPWGTAVGRALLERGLIEKPDRNAPGPFRLGNADQVRSLVVSAGFELLLLADVPVTWRYRSFDEYWEVTSDLSLQLTTVLQTLGAGDAERVRRRVREAFRSYESATGELAIPGLCHNVLARKPLSARAT